jgi:hypothetical protein
VLRLERDTSKCDPSGKIPPVWDVKGDKDWVAGRFEEYMLMRKKEGMRDELLGNKGLAWEKMDVYSGPEVIDGPNARSIPTQKKSIVSVRIALCSSLGFKTPIRLTGGLRNS